MESPDLDVNQLEIAEFSSIESQDFKNTIVIPYFKDIYKVSSRLLWHQPGEWTIFSPSGFGSKE